MQYGLRAGFIILRKYINKYGRNTIAKIVHSWSPDGVSKEIAYMQSVSQWAGIRLYDEINFDDKGMMCLIVQGMAKVETGRTIRLNIIGEAYEMAKA